MQAKFFSHYKKMAGTAAVFINAHFDPASPVERDGLIWQAQELHLQVGKLKIGQEKPAMANALALEGLEDYAPANEGDVRKVSSLAVKMIYIAEIHGWVQLKAD